MSQSQNGVKIAGLKRDGSSNGHGVISAKANKALVRDYLEEVFNLRRVEALPDFVTSDVVSHTATLSSRMVGLEDLRWTVSGLLTAFPDCHYTVEDMIAEGDKVACRTTMHGTHQGQPSCPVFGGLLQGVVPTGTRVAVTHTHVFRIADGKIVEHWLNRDDLEMMRQLDLIPRPGLPRIWASLTKSGLIGCENGSDH